MGEAALTIKARTFCCREPAMYRPALIVIGRAVDHLYLQVVLVAGALPQEQKAGRDRQHS